MDNKEQHNNSENVSPLHDNEDLGLAGKLTKSFMHNPLTLLLLLACFAIGIAGLILTPRQEDPQISVPMVDIYIGYPGGSSSEVASLVAEPLERIMSEIPGVKHVYSASMHGKAMVTVQFDVGQKMGDSLVKLYDKLNSNMDKMPPGATAPLVKPKGVDDVPMMTLTFWSKQVDDAALRLIALDVMQELNEIADTSQSFIVSGRKEELRIEVKPERLSGYGISLQQIANTIASANTEKTVGGVESGRNKFEIITGSFLSSATEVERLVVAINEGNPVYLRDVANVFHGPSETNKLVNYYTGPSHNQTHDHQDVVANGEAAVTLALAKKTGTNGVAVASDILERLNEMKGRLIPGNINVEVTRDYGESANNKVNGLMFKLVIVTVAVSILIWYFLNWRAALVCFIVIPNVILVTIFIALVSGYTIDRVSLFALIFAIGILVDDAIVVIENMYRRWGLEGKIEDSITIDAVREVGNPTILATFTVIAALLPMAAVRGMMGPYMEPIPALGSVAMMYSLFAAFVYTPYLALVFKPSMKMIEDMEKNEHDTVQKLDKLYRKTLTPLIEDRKKGYIFLFSMIFVFFACTSLFYTKSVRVKMMPLDNKPEFNVVVNFPEGTALPVTANLTRQLTEIVRQQPEVTAIQTYVGTASPFNFNGLVRHYYTRIEPWQADIQIQLVSKKLRDRTSHEIAVEVRKDLQGHINQQIDDGFYNDKNKPKIQIVEMPPGPPVLQSIVAEIYGPTAEARRQVTKDLTQMFEKAQYIDDVDNLMPAENTIWKFKVDREKALRTGVSVDTINKTLEMAMGGYVLGDVKDGSILEPTMIVLQVPLDIRSNFGNLTQLPIPTNSGTTIPLSELGNFVKATQDPVIFHKDLRSVEYVTGETVGRLSAPIYGMFEVEEMLKDYTGPRGEKITGNMLGVPSTSETNRGVSFEWGGEWTVTYETFRDMGMAFGIAVILIYMLVVWEFGNFILPAIIISPIPLTLVGIIPGHWLMDAEFTATSMIGFIALAGIIVRNSILLVDYTREQIGLGENADEAIVMACITRTRPIIITALALVVGSTAILFDPIFQGMAISLMFGVIISTVLTLFVIPLGCSSAKSVFYPDGIVPDSPDSVENKTVLSNGNETAKGSFSDTALVILGKVLFFIYTVIEFIISWTILLIQYIKSFFGKEKTEKQSQVSSTAKKETPVKEKPVVDKQSKLSDTEQVANKVEIDSKRSEKADSSNKASSTETVIDKVSDAPIKSEEGTGKSKIEETAVAKVESRDNKDVPTESSAVVKNAVPKKSTTKKAATTKKATTKKATTKATSKKAPVKKKVAAKKTVTKKTVTKKSVAKKSAVKKSSPTAKKGRRGIRLKGDISDSSET